MERVGFTMRLLPGQEAAYRQRHADVWPEILDALKTVTQAGQNPFDSMFGSVRRLSTAEAAALKPRKLQVVTVKTSDTLQSLAARMAYTDAPLERFLVLNGLTSTSRLAAGQKIKLVTY